MFFAVRRSRGGLCDMVNDVLIEARTMYKGTFYIIKPHINPAPNERNIVYLVSYLKIKCISDPQFFMLLICDYSTFHTYQSRDYATFL